MKKIVIIVSSVIVSLFAIIGLGIGSYRMLKQAEHDEMVRIVYSDEVKELIESRLTSYDAQALSQQGKIKSYKIDESSIKHHPMGGILFTVLVNENPTMEVYFDLEKNSEKIEDSGGGYSKEFKELIGELE